ncbi:unnamed protein product [Mytilus edulis]|uniref:Reverse transcriptase RNase H-like domain-containing protein n=1 Tax=Mytilus edulis TaxID=6550 RepID=A0A8S3V920_MYTED|nr:unnamed protein product [Mytilus edulis]
MKLRSGKTTRRSRNNKMNNLQGFHPLSPVPGTKVGEGTIAKEIKTITEEETEEANPDTSENLIQPEEQGLQRHKTKSNYTFNFVPNVTNVPPKLNYNFPTVSQPTTSTANYSNFPPLINSNPVVNHQPLVQAARMPNVISLTKFTEKQSAKQWWTLFMQWVLYHSMTEAATLAAFPFQLGDNVLQWYLNSDDSVRTSLNNLKQAFLKRFSPDKTLFDTNVLCIKQIPGENVDDYVAMVIKQTAECDIPAKMIVGIAIQGLRGPLAKIVMPQKPKSMEELREMTLLAEKTIKCTESPDESLTATIVGMQAEVANLSEKLSVASLAAISTINRGDSGNSHRQTNFQSQPRNTNSNFICFRCNRRNCDISRNLYIAETATVCTINENKGFARSQKNLKLKPLHQIDVPVKISKCVENQVILLEPVKQLENANLMAAKCLVKVKRGRAMFKLCNPTDTEIFIRYNTILATISDIDTSCIIPLEQNEASVNNLETCREKANFEKTPIHFDLSDSELNSEQKRQLQEFLKTQRDVFATNLKELGKSDRYAHKIETFESTPIKMPFYRQNPVMQKEIDRQVNELIEAGIVIESNSEYHSPVVLVKKGDGTFRFCCDYRKINLQTRPIFHPLPRLESVFDCLAESEAHIFSSFDLHSGYFQIQIDPETRHTTAFITRNGIYEWTRMPMETQVAFEKLKQALVTAPILVHAKMNKPFHVTADASNSAIGYYLSQLDETGREHVIAYGGRSLSKAERNWSTSDLECLAVLEAIREHRSYLTVEFTVFTDHKALQYLMQQKRVTGRLARWALELQEFNFKIVHKPGRQNVVADALSRRHYDNAEINACVVENERVEVQFFYDNTPIISSIETNQVDETLNNLPAIGKLQKECPDIRDIYLYKEQNQLPKEDKRKRKVIATSEYYDLCNGVLYHWFQKRLRKVTKEERLIRQIVLPKVLRKDALRAFHDNEVGVPI